jgi:hypothetical protein
MSLKLVFYPCVVGCVRVSVDVALDNTNMFCVDGAAGQV